MSRLLLLDGHSLAYRAFFALPVENFSTSTGQHTNGVYGFTSMLINVLRDEAPTHVAVAFDVSRQTFRAAEYADYKATRSATPSEFQGQVALVREVLDALRIRHVQVDGFEADDVIATLTAMAEAEGMEVVICTGDRDAFQLVNDNVSLLYPVRGVSEVWRMDPKAVEEKYLVTPERYSDLAALVGETSDNLPGVPGVGPKTAAKWLTQYGDLAGVVAHADEIKGKAGESLREHLSDVLRNRRLNHLVRDLSLDVTIADLERATWDREEVHKVFDGLEFRVLRERLFETFDAAPDEAEGGFDLDASVLASDEVGPWLDEHASAEPTGVHVVGIWGRGTGDVSAVALASAGDAAAYIDVLELDETGEKALADWLGDASRPKVLHDAKGQMHALRARGLPVAGVTMDTALAAYLVKPDQRSFDLADLVVRHLGRELRAEEQAGGQGMLDMSFGGADDQVVGQDAMVRARAVLDLSGPLGEQLEATGGTELLRDIELPLVEILAAMERTGIAVDTDALSALEADFDAKVRGAQQDAWDAIGGESINLGSPKQLQTVLFETLGLPKTRRTKTGYTTDADALTDLYAKTEHPFLEALLRHRDAARLRVTVEGLIKSVAEDQRIHTTYIQTIAATGRLSSTDPNLQNVPIRTEEGRRIREVFVVGSADGVPFESLLSADYSQIEMRIMAHLSGDEGLIEAFRTGEDLHRFVGARVFSVAPADVTAEMRSKVKAMSYGLAYGLSAFGLSKQLTISTGEAQGLMDEYFARFGGVRDYLREVVAQARGTGYTETMLGRRRYLPDLTSSNRQRREMAERMALNAPIQGSAADIIKLAMIGVDRALRESGARSRMLLQVHDELVLEVAAGERADVEALVRTEMGRAIELDVPLDVSVGHGRSWHDAAH
ncbi:DNA polymerase I [Knoellia aerolata]|uniref:DNA polymerase I n=1 Tax=Knoellia aerolata DSM 18566 TaxID=1385519 RepID=A0A0A0K330_9MICO|nr:DNA polymerase I [Knoellia aerolata]KGN42722.1 DNA polymerase I [Knoellia aerolata DSM 18566]